MYAMVNFESSDVTILRNVVDFFPVQLFPALGSEWCREQLDCISWMYLQTSIATLADLERADVALANLIYQVRRASPLHFHKVHSNASAVRSDLKKARCLVQQAMNILGHAQEGIVHRQEVEGVEV